jgi:hypothetical protein
VTAATKVTVTDAALTVAQVASLNSVHNVAKYVYNIVDNDANIRAAIDTDATTQGYLSSATTVTANAGQSLKFASVGETPAFGITGTKAELSALSSVLKDGNLVYKVTVADLNADLEFYSTLSSGSFVSVTDSFTNLTSGNAAVGTASKITVEGAITKAQADTVLALSAVDSTVYNIEDSAANLTDGDAIDGAVNVTATGQATVAQAEVIVDATNTGTTTVNITDTDEAIADAIFDEADALDENAANNITVTGTTGLSDTDAAAVLAAAKGNATISKVTGAADDILGLTLAVGDTITLAAPTGTVTVDQAVKLKAMATNVAYDLQDTAENLALADVSVLNGATDISVDGDVVSIDLAVKIDAATNTGTNTFEIEDTAANVLAATTAQLQLDSSIRITDAFVTADVATALIAKDVASDTLNGTQVTIAHASGGDAGEFIIRDTVAKVTAAANAAAVTAAQTVTVTDSVVTVQQGVAVLNAKTTAVFNITDTYANINNNYIAGNTGAAAKAVDLTVTGTVTVSQANNLVNTIGAANDDSAGKEIFTLRDTANNVAINAALGNVNNRIVDNAQSISVTGVTTVARAGNLSELTNLVGKYAISDTADNVSAAFNTFNQSGAADRATVLGASSITLTTDVLVEQAAGTSADGDELLGLYKVPGLRFTVTDSGAAIVAGLGGPDATALTEATALYLSNPADLTVTEAETLTAQANFKGYDEVRTDSTPGFYNIGDTSTVVLNASYDLLANASVVTVAASGNVDLSAIDRALVINGSDTADTIVGSNYADTITGGSGADVLTGGDGADVFVFAAGSSGVNNDAPVADQILDFLIGTDKLQFSGVTDVVSGQLSAVQEAVTLLDDDATAAEIATAMASANTTDLGVSFALYGGDTYVYFETDGDTTTHEVDNNVLIKLVGVDTLPTFAADVIA